MNELGYEVVAWLKAFGRIIASPRAQTFVDLGGEADGKWKGLVAWLVFATMVVFAVGNQVAQVRYEPTSLILVLVLAPVSALVWALLVHGIYRKGFGRHKDKHAELTYVLGSIAVIVLLVDSVVAYLPAIGRLMETAVFLYGLVLAVMAVGAITKLRVWQSVVAIGLGTLGAAFIVVILALFVAVLTGANWQQYRP